MSLSIASRIAGLLVASLGLAGCQGLFPGEEDSSIGAARLSQAGRVASTQRLGEDGYPLLGAYPSAAAPQLSNEAVSQTKATFTGIAQSRAAAGASVSSNAGTIAQLQNARARQAAVAEQTASQPAASGTTGRGPRPQDVLRQIEASETQTN
ncbi:hypothetical protein DYI37_06550 [Fulvimarina endophytica]|uniref:DUF3035 domain-containing protein n=1 Tax=Fulvimarina endophytica TaxID=2293836 RepID=A0A371X8E7_9HYPH|nr:hypothetical protein [Fulvimarina endophytica]RFC65470.1 hypothetical protein DYI37_06550 [Fulvimarina endophytica]